MTRYLVRRLFWAAVSFFVVTVLTFILFFVVPSDPARVFAATDSPDSVVRMRHFLALDHPLYVQYLREMRRLLIEHSLGYSFRTRQNVGDAIGGAAPVTLALVIGGLALASFTAFVVGIFSAMRPHSVVDRVAVGLVLIGVSVHPGWVRLPLSWAVGAELHRPPPTGYFSFPP